MKKTSTLADRVRVKREERGLNQADLAKKSGITQATISRIESGEVTQPKSENLLKLAQALGVTVDFLVGKSDKMEFGDALKADEKAKVLFRGYERLTEDRRTQLQSFLEWLLEEEKKKES